MNNKLVSVIVRTCNRPEVLKLALESIRNQTYNDIETIVVEDGKETAKILIDSMFADMNIIYRATNKKMGRSIVGNIGLKLAKGDYLCFLDDDDIFYPNHIETLLAHVHENTISAAYSIAEESQIRIISMNPYRVIEKRVIVRYKQPFNRLLLYSFNYLPIQSVLFDRRFYDQCGGFDESLDALEDWDLWVRYSTLGRFDFVPKVTSKYYVRYRNKDKKRRGKTLDSALPILRKKFEKYQTDFTVSYLQEEMDYVINVYNQKKIIYYLKQVWNHLVYGDR